MRVLFFVVLPFLLLWPASAAEPVDFERDIQPIFADNCIDCHGPDKQKAALRLDQRALMLRGGDSGLATIVPGKPEKSFLIEVVKQLDPEMAMPPKGDPLAKEEVALLERWIKEGAQWPGQMDATLEVTSDLWSLKPVARPAVPGDAGSPIDAFLKEKLGEKKLAYNPPADARSLIRRTAILLTGIPPTAERIQLFREDYAGTAAQRDRAFRELVEELLDSPHFGERWAQHWLDVIRWAESNGGEATGFLVAGPHVPAATVGREPTAIRQARADRMDEIMQTVSASMLGMTVSCARCHNHKFDPISIKDYYALTAVFQGVEFGGRYPEFGEEHPRKKRAKELYPAMFKQRRVLRETCGQWLEDWGGFHELAFPATKTKALRVEFAANGVGVDELDVYGPADYNKNLARASAGATLKTDESMTKRGNEVWKANDGKFGTMAWRAKGQGGKKPWVEIHFPQTVEVDRFRLSANREYYFETDFIDAWVPKIAGFKISVMKPDGTWREVGKTGWAAELLKKNPQAKAASAKLHELIGTIQEEGPRHSFIGQFTKPAVTRVLHRGSPENPRDEVVPAGFEIMGGDLGLGSETPDPQRRKAFAEWVTRPEHPLTARVMVNRVWHHVFGTGLVPTTSDFGEAGVPPSHPELLDYLAAEFVDPQDRAATPWSVKDLLRSLVHTEAFRQSSAPRADGLAADAGAFYLWRFPPRRVEAEVIRDGILQASGKLDRRLGGPSYRIHNVKKTYAQWEVVDNYSEATWRRMIYQERMRRVDDRIFTAFDFPDCGQVRAKRPVSTTPLQALNLMNSSFAVTQSQHIAERAKTERPRAPVERVFQLTLGRSPDAEERKAAQAVARGSGLHVVARSLMNANEFAFLP